MENNSKELGYRLYIIVREDLGMPIGKAMGQSAHASEGTLFKCQTMFPEVYDGYMNTGNRKKIVLRIKSLEKLLNIQGKAVQAGLVHHLVTDAGHTIFAEPTITCLGIGPIDSSDPIQQEALKAVVKGLQLYS